MSMPAAKTVRPFLFERSFDDPNSPRMREKREAAEAEKKAKEAEVEPEPEVPTFSEEELEAAKTMARAEGHAEGFAEGRAEAEAEAEAEIAKALELLSHEVARLGERQVHANEQQEAALARVTKEILERLVPVYVRNHGTEEAVDVVESCLASLTDTGRLTVRCHDRDAERIEELIRDATAQTAFEGAIRIVPDQSYGPSDISANWGAGGAQRRYEQIWSGIEQSVDSAIAAVEERLAESGFVNETGRLPESSQHAPADEGHGVDDATEAAEYHPPADSNDAVPADDTGSEEDAEAALPYTEDEVPVAEENPEAPSPTPSIEAAEPPDSDDASVNMSHSDTVEPEANLLDGEPSTDETEDTPPSIDVTKDEV